MPPKCAIDRRGRRVVPCARPTGAPAVRRVRSACEHVDDSEVWHNAPLENGLRRSECTSFNATCGDDSVDLMRYCVPQVYGDVGARDEVWGVVTRERAEARSGKHNLGDRHVSRIDGLLRASSSSPLPALHEPTADSARPWTVAVGSHDATVDRLVVSASADPFDSWPTIRGEYPVMVRRPDDSTDFYASVATDSESE